MGPPRSGLPCRTMPKWFSFLIETELIFAADLNLTQVSREELCREIAVPTMVGRGKAWLRRRRPLNSRLALTKQSIQLGFPETVRRSGLQSLQAAERGEDIANSKWSKRPQCRRPPSASGLWSTAFLTVPKAAKKGLSRESHRRRRRRQGDAKDVA